MLRLFRKLGITAAVGLACAALVSAIASDLAVAHGATNAPVRHTASHRYPALFSQLALKRVKKNPDRTAWQYQLRIVYRGGLSRRYPALRPSNTIPSVKLSWNLPAGMKAKGVGRKFKNPTQPLVLVRSVRVGHGPTVTFWADPTPPNIPGRCFTVVAQGLTTTGRPIAHAPLQRTRACIPKPPPGHSGPQALYIFGFQCNDVDSNGNGSMQDGVIKDCVDFDAANASLYNYKYIPYQTTLFVPAGSSFNGQINARDPKPPKADLSWHWVMANGQRVTVNGQQEVQWTNRHVNGDTRDSWVFTLTVPGPGPLAKVCLDVTAQPLVWLPPVQSAHQCYVDSSVP